MKKVSMVQEYSKRLSKLADELADMGQLVAAAHTQAAADSLDEGVQ